VCGCWDLRRKDKKKAKGMKKKRRKEEGGKRSTLFHHAYEMKDSWQQIANQRVLPTPKAHGAPWE
jgi:hypothetical protein